MLNIMTTNPFDEIAERLTRIEKCLISLKEREMPESSEAYNRPLTIKDAAKLLNLSIATIYSKVSRKELPVNRQGGRLYFFNDDLIDYIKKGRKKTSQELRIEATDKMVGLNKKRVI
jgi:excisionase family DNA binding protein